MGQHPHENHRCEAMDTTIDEHNLKKIAIAAAMLKCFYGFGHGQSNFALYVSALRITSFLWNLLTLLCILTWLAAVFFVSDTIVNRMKIEGVDRVFFSFFSEFQQNLFNFALLSLSLLVSITSIIMKWWKTYHSSFVWNEIQFTKQKNLSSCCINAINK